MIKTQTTPNILMVRPASFGFNEETAENNAFQVNDQSLSPQEIKSKAIAEFDQFVIKLKTHGILVSVFQDSDSPTKPDAIFPNNWISFHEDGSVITYPMYSPKRRLERTDEVLNLLEHDFWITEHIHLEDAEEDNKYLEGTGSMVLDRENQIAYACISQRTDVNLLDQFCEIVGYNPISFVSTDSNDELVYHSNVMMAIGEDFAVVCLDSIKNTTERQALVDSFEETDKEIIPISLEQMNQFAGNMLQVRSVQGDRYLVMSETAKNCLNEKQIASINRHTRILTGKIPTIEKYGGGSVRCMMAEVFLPEKSLS